MPAAYGLGRLSARKCDRAGFVVDGKSAKIAQKVLPQDAIALPPYSFTQLVQVRDHNRLAKT
jgi:hypothetical protein